MADDFELDTDDLNRRMEGAIASLRTELASLRTGRASGSMLEPIQVEAYGQMTPVNQLGTINVPEPQHGHDQRLGPWHGVQGREGDPRLAAWASTRRPTAPIIMLPIPELNEERRRELTKVAAGYAEHARVAVRNLRRDGMDQIKKAKARRPVRGRREVLGGARSRTSPTATSRIVDQTLEAKQAEIMQV